MIRQTTIGLTAAGVNGAATASDSTSAPLNGILQAVRADHSAGGAGTTDLTLTCGAIAIPLMTKADSVTDAWFFPVVQCTGADGAAIAGQYTKLPLDGYVTASLAQANSGQTCAVTIIWDDLT